MFAGISCTFLFLQSVLHFFFFFVSHGVCGVGETSNSNLGGKGPVLRRSRWFVLSGQSTHAFFALFQVHTTTCTVATNNNNVNPRTIAYPRFKCRFNSVLRKSASAAAATEMGSGGLSLQESLRRAAASFSLPSSPSTSEVPPPSPAPASVSGADDVDDDTVDGKEEGETGEVEEEATAKVRVGPAEALADALGTQGESSSSEGYLSWDDSVLPSWAEDLWGTPGFGRSPGSMTTEDDAVTQVLRYLPPSLAEGFLSGGEADELVCFHGRMNTMRKMGRRGSRGL